MVATGWATAVQILVAQATGAGAAQRQRVGRTVDVALAVAVVLGMLAGLGLLLAAPALLGVLAGEARLAGEAVGYLRPVLLSVPFAGVTAVLRALYGGLGDTKLPMRVALLVNALNVPFDLALVYGLRLGATGSGIGTALAVVAGTVLLCWRARALRAEHGLFRRAHLREPGAVGGALWRIGWPETVMLVSGFGANAVLAGVVARLGVTAVAAWALLGSVTSLLWTVVFSCSSGLAILGGQRLGAGDADGAAALRRTGWALGAVLAGAVALSFLAAGGPLLGLLSDDGAVVRQAALAAPVLLLQAPLMVLSMTDAGLLRAGGDTRSIMVAATAGAYACELPLAWLLGPHLGWGLAGVYLAAVAYWVVRWALTAARYRAGAWREGAA
jgi:putative MATE family efflux protein